MKTNYMATCPEDTKDVLAKELAEMGASDVSTGYRLVRFNASVETFYKLHLCLSTASNLFAVLRECSAKSAQMLHSQARRVKWTQLFDANQSFRVDGIAGDRGDEAMSSNQISKEIRAAIEEAFEFHCDKKPSVDLKDPQVLITAHVYQGRASICVSTSKKALHKRGYRLGKHPAPLKETVAASLLHLLEFKGQTAFYDPMCGSGTIAIEAAFIAQNKACNIHRKKGQFGLELLKTFDKDLWRRIGEQMRLKMTTEPKFSIFASDIDDKYVTEARENALRARVEKNIQFTKTCFFDSKKPAENGLMVSNLPYGERLESNEEDLKALYKRFGDHLKKEYTGWRAALFVNADSPWKFMGLKPSKKVSLYNGSIPTKLLVYDLYEGSRG